MSIRDIEPLLVQPGDLSPSFSGGAITNSPPVMFKNVPSAQKEIFQPFEKDGRQQGGVAAFLYETDAEAENAYNIVIEAMSPILPISDIGDEGLMSRLRGIPFVDLAFRRCNIVIHIRSFDKDVSNITAYAKKLDDRLTPVVSKHEPHDISMKSRSMLEYQALTPPERKAEPPGGREGETEVASEIESHIRNLKHHDWQVRVEAAEALQNIGDERAVKPLIDALRDPVWRVRDDAAIALGKIGDLRAAQPLLHAMEDQSGYVRWHAAWALGELQVYQAVPLLITALDDEFESLGRYYVREAAAEALGEIGDEQAIEPLKRALEDKSDEVQEAAAKALKKIEERHSNRL
jgi:hypothetical protein